jgi:hypothetical protein
MSFLLVVARTAPASEDSVQLGGVKRPCILTVREPPETSGVVEEPGRRQAATRLADGERSDERAVRRRVLLHQALQGFGDLMDGMGWQDIKSLRHGFVTLLNEEREKLRIVIPQATAARQVSIAAARKPRCVDADVR